MYSFYSIINSSAAHHLSCPPPQCPDIMMYCIVLKYCILIIIFCITVPGRLTSLTAGWGQSLSPCCRCHLDSPPSPSCRGYCIIVLLLYWLMHCITIAQLYLLLLSGMPLWWDRECFFRWSEREKLLPQCSHLSIVLYCVVWYCIVDSIVSLSCIIAAMSPPVPPLSRVDSEVSM